MGEKHPVEDMAAFSFFAAAAGSNKSYKTRYTLTAAVVSVLAMLSICYVGLTLAFVSDCTASAAAFAVPRGTSTGAGNIIHSEERRWGERNVAGFPWCLRSADQTSLWLDQRLLAVLVRQYRLAVCCWLVAAMSAVQVLARRRGVRHTYLVDFACFKPKESMKCNYEVAEFISRSNAHRFTLPSLHFQRKIFLRSGLYEETYLPESLVLHNRKPSLEDARQEAEDVLFGSVGMILRRTGVRPQDISILITNCSLHNPLPSYTSMIVNHFKLRADCKTFHLGGMGCSASLVACKLASDLLRREPNQYALIVSTENITLNWYLGNDKPMLVTNCLFRVGCAAMLLTNKPSERARSKYELLHLVRTHKAADDKAFGCAQQREDSVGIVGIALNKNLMAVAANALRTNIAHLGPLILPYSEQLRYLFGLLCRRLLNLQVKQHQPDFKLAIEHFVLHAGGRAVIDEIQKNLLLDDYLVEPSRSTLQRWGNTSASSVWYVLAYMEAQGRIKAKDKVWMLGLGSGFKCNSAVWRAISDVVSTADNPWTDCIHRYPVILPNSTTPAI